MKRIYLAPLIVFLLMIQKTNAQLMPQFSQYMFNDYALNPAIGGTNDYWQVKTNYHYQWAGVPEGPRTYMLSAYGPHKSLPMGYGGYIFSDVTSIITNYGVYGSYAYNIQISGDIRLSMGLFAGVIYENVDLTAGLGSDDPIIIENGTKATKIMPDGSLGFYLYTSQYYAGLSINHMFFNNLSLLNEGDVGYGVDGSRIKQYLNIQGGYKYNIDRNFDIEPSVLLKTALNYDFITDINIRTIYQKMVWGGVGFRYTFKNPEAIIVFVGYNYNDMLNIGYSYDLTMSKLRYTSTGSHEVMIGVKFNDIRKSRSKRKIR